MEKQEFTPEFLKALRSEHAPNATDAQFTLWIEHCKQRDLVPVVDVLLQIRSSKEWDPEVGAKVSKKKVIFITTIGGLRKIAERTGLYGGPLPTKWVYLNAAGNPELFSIIPLPPTAADKKLKFRQPWAAVAYIVRKGWDQPVQFVARFDAYAQTFKTTEGSFLTSMWSQRGPEQLEKCAKAGGYREAFPETQGLYIEEELGHDAEPEPQAQPTTPAPAPVALTTAVNQAPAKPTETPRPEEAKPALASKPEPKPEPAPEKAKESTAPKANPEPQASHEFEQKINDLKVEMSGEKQPEPDRAPTTAEKKQYGEHLKTFKVDNAALKAWILTFTSAASIGKMTKGQYEKVIAKLDAVAELGQAALDSLVTGKEN
jgi:hypothetical protein